MKIAHDKGREGFDKEFKIKFLKALFEFRDITDALYPLYGEKQDNELSGNVVFCD